MDLVEFASGPPSIKPWLVINASHIHVGPGDGPVSAAQYSQTSIVDVANTLGPVSITAGATHTGTLVIPPLPVGSVVRFTASGKVNTTPANAVCNFGILIDGLEKTGPTSISTGGNAISGFAEIKASVTVYPSANAVAFISVSEINSVGPGSGFSLLQTNQFSYDNTAAHAFDLAAYFSTASAGNNFAAYQVLCELVNAN